MTHLKAQVLLKLGLGAMLALAWGCGETSTNPDEPWPTNTAGSATTSGGASAGAGAHDGGGSGAGTTHGGAGPDTMGGQQTGGNGGGKAGGNGGSAGGDGIGGSAGGTPTSLAGPITAVVKSDGCGQQYAGPIGMPITLQTKGVKDANCADKAVDGTPVCGEWSTPREYFVYLPKNYDPTKPYSLVFEAPGCGAKGSNVYPLNGLSDSAIRVGISPGPNSTGHATNPQQGCFDDREGDDSIDFVFYEDLYDVLSSQLCFDRRRVFAAGNSSGAWLTNELGCKYAGDALRPLRGIMVMSGGLPTMPAYTPTCSNAPMAGMWIHEVGDTNSPFTNNRIAIARAMVENHCAPGQTYDTADLVDYAIGGGQPDNTCKSILGCDPLYPLVVCLLPGQGIGVRDNVVEPGFATFVRSFQYPPLLPP
jgi:hypothetical protein